MNHCALQYMRNKVLNNPCYMLLMFRKVIWLYYWENLQNYLQNFLLQSSKKAVPLIENKDFYHCGYCMKMYKLVREASKLKKSLLLKSRKFYKRQPSLLAVRKSTISLQSLISQYSPQDIWKPTALLCFLFKRKHYSSADRKGDH